MNRTASQIRLESQDIPTVQEILEGLNENEIRVIFDLVLLLKERRKRNKTSKAANSKLPRIPNSANGVNDRLWFLIELIESFMNLYSQDDSELVSRIGAWFKELDHVPSSGYFPDAIPVHTMDLFNGLDDKVMLSIIRLIAFFHREGANATFGEDPSRIMIEMDERSRPKPAATAARRTSHRGLLRCTSK